MAYRPGGCGWCWTRWRRSTAGTGTVLAPARLFGPTRPAKGDKHRLVGVDAGTAALLRQWLDVRRKRGVNGRAPVFCTLDGGDVDQSYVRHLLPRLAAKAGIDKRIHAHGLRHAYAASLEREGATISTIRDLARPLLRGGD